MPELLAQLKALGIHNQFEGEMINYGYQGWPDSYSIPEPDRESPASGKWLTEVKDEHWQGIRCRLRAACALKHRDGGLILTRQLMVPRRHSEMARAILFLSHT